MCMLSKQNIGFDEYREEYMCVTLAFREWKGTKN